MGKFTTLAIDQEQYDQIITTLKTGYTDLTGRTHRPNECIATALMTEFNLGIRISDIVKLTLSDIVKDGTHYRLEIVEKKTKKPRTHTVNTVYYNYLKSYCECNHISPTARMFPVTERAIQKQTQLVSEYLGLDRVSTHSFRKAAGNDLYESSGHDIELVRAFYQHTNTVTTQAYIKRSDVQLENALANHVRIV